MIAESHWLVDLKFGAFEDAKTHARWALNLLYFPARMTQLEAPSEGFSQCLLLFRGSNQIKIGEDADEMEIRRLGEC